jgi:hypothetical protein
MTPEPHAVEWLTTERQGLIGKPSIVYHGSVLGRLAGKRGELAWVFELATLYGGRFERGPGRC